MWKYRLRKWPYLNLSIVLGFIFLVMTGLFFSIEKETIQIPIGNTLEEVQQQWFARNVGKMYFLPGMIIFDCSAKPCTLSPKMEPVSNFSHEDYPYFKIFYTPDSQVSEMRVLYKSGKRQGFQGYDGGMHDQDQSIFYFNGQQYKFLSNPFYQVVGFHFKGIMKYKGAELATALGPWDRIRFFFHQFTETEKYLAYAINSLLGIKIYGTRFLAMVLISFFVVCLLYLFLGPHHHTRAQKTKIIFSFLVIGLTLSEIPQWMELIIGAPHQLEKTVFKWDKDEETRSRYGEELLKFDKAIADKLPEGAKVYFPQARHLIPREWASNVLEYFYHDRFVASKYASADYIFFFRPAGMSWNLKKGTVSHKHGEKKVEPVYAEDPDKAILKIIK